MYLAITQATADWLLARSGLLDSVYQNLIQHASRAMGVLSGKELAEGPVRVAGSGDRRLIAIWNTDYLSGTGEEAWGFVRLLGPMSLAGRDTIGREVFERSLYVINQRLQGLFIDGAFIHRSHPNGTHSCLSGRGSEARHESVGYAEERTAQGSSVSTSIVVIGPEYNFQKLADEAGEASAILKSIFFQANELLAPGRSSVAVAGAALNDLRDSIQAYSKVQIEGAYDRVQTISSQHRIGQIKVSKTIGLTFDEWTSQDGPMSESQRRIFESDAIERHPLRIIGPAGSGKTILMQLLVLRIMATAQERGRDIRIVYVVHNAAMVKLVAERFDILDPTGEKRGTKKLVIETLSNYAVNQLGLRAEDIVDQEAQGAKLFQLAEVGEALKETLRERGDSLAKNNSLFFSAMDAEELFGVLSRLVAVDISIAIKGHGLEGDRKRYVESERRLSRLHGVLSTYDRGIVFDTFEKYKARVFSGYRVLDSDDVALSLLGQLRTPVWELRRADEGFDYVFVDETQLFNENERRVLPLLSSAKSSHVPVVIALDEAQDPHGIVSSGMATLGIPDAASESLSSIHRSTKEIVALAFFLIQQTTDLFGADFPDFTATSFVPDNYEEAGSKPRIETSTTERLGKFVLKRVRELRSQNIWRIAIICFADGYFDSVRGDFEKEGKDLPRFDLLKRGERLPVDAPVVVLTKPEYVGGQEFDAVILVGLEQGIVPPRIVGNSILSAAVDQQLLRELYVAVSRARSKAVFVISKDATPTPILTRAITAGLVDYPSGAPPELPFDRKL